MANISVVDNDLEIRFAILAAVIGIDIGILSFIHSQGLFKVKDPKLHTVSKNCVKSVECGGRKAADQIRESRRQAADCVFDGSVEAQTGEVQFAGQALQPGRIFMPVRQIVPVRSFFQLFQRARYEADVNVVREIIPCVSKKKQCCGVDHSGSCLFQAVVPVEYY